MLKRAAANEHALTKGGHIPRPLSSGSILQGIWAWKIELNNGRCERGRCMNWMFKLPAVAKNLIREVLRHDQNHMKLSGNIWLTNLLYGWPTDFPHAILFVLHIFMKLKQTSGKITIWCFISIICVLGIFPSHHFGPEELFSKCKTKWTLNDHHFYKRAVQTLPSQRCFSNTFKESFPCEPKRFFILVVNWWTTPIFSIELIVLCPKDLMNSLPCEGCGRFSFLVVSNGFTEFVKECEVIETVGKCI